MSPTTVFKISTKPELRDAAVAAANELGIPLSEYLRRAMIHLVNSRANPFPEHSGLREGRPGHMPKVAARV